MKSCSQLLVIAVMLNLWICRKDWNPEIWLAKLWTFQSRTLPCNQLELGEGYGVAVVAGTVEPSVLLNEVLTTLPYSLKVTYKDCFTSLISLRSTPDWISCHCSVITSDSCLSSSGDKSVLRDVVRTWGVFWYKVDNIHRSIQQLYHRHFWFAWYVSLKPFNSYVTLPSILILISLPSLEPAKDKGHLPYT